MRKALLAIALLAAPLSAQAQGIPIQDLPLATTPLGSSDLFAVTQGNVFHKLPGTSLGAAAGLGATLTFGTHLTSGGSSYNGFTGVTISSDATNANTASTIVARDGSGNFAAGTITASLTGHASLDLAIANNLSDVASPSASATSLGLGAASAVGFASLTLTSNPVYAVSGATTNGHCVEFGTGSILTDTGASCSSGGGGGSVISVGMTVPAASILGVSGSPITTSGTLGLTTTGTSGGIPYFSSTSQLSSSAALAANAVVLGKGAGVAPATTTTGTGVVTALGQSVTGSGGIVLATSPSIATPTLTGTISLPNSLTLISTAVTTGGDVLSFGPPGTIGNFNSLFTNYGAKQISLNDRVVVGAAASVGIGNLPASPQTWVDEIFSFNMQNTQLGVISTLGLNAITGASRTSDFGGVTNAIGVQGFGVNDDTNGAHSASGAWGGYFVAQRNAGSFQALAIETDIINYGPIEVMTPETPFPGGQNVNLWAACGGGVVAPAPLPTNCSAALAVIGNSEAFETGILFQRFALDFGRGAGGAGVAIDMFGGSTTGADITWTNEGDAVAVDMFGLNDGLHIRGGPIQQQLLGSAYGDNFKGNSGAGDIQFSLGTDSGAAAAYIKVITNHGLEFFTNNTLVGKFTSGGALVVSGLSGSGSRPVCVTSTGGLEAGTLAAGLVTCP